MYRVNEFRFSFRCELYMEQYLHCIYSLRFIGPLFLDHLAHTTIESLVRDGERVAKTTFEFTVEELLRKDSREKQHMETVLMWKDESFGMNLLLSIKELDNLQFMTVWVVIGFASQDTCGPRFLPLFSTNYPIPVSTVPDLSRPLVWIRSGLKTKGK